MSHVGKLNDMNEIGDCKELIHELIGVFFLGLRCVESIDQCVIGGRRGCEDAIDVQKGCEVAINVQ